MLVTFSFCLLILCEGITNLKTDNRFLDVINRQLIQNIAPYEAIIIDNTNHTRNTEYNFIRKSLICQIPTTNVYLDTYNLIEFFNNLKPVNYYVIFHHVLGDSLKSLQNIIDLLMQLHFSFNHPKCLIIFNNKNLRDDKWLETFLEYAWVKKFLDISVIEIDVSTTNVFLHYFLPFDNSLIKQPMTAETELFPNKLKNVHRYPLKVFGCQYIPYMNFSKINEITGIQTKDLHYPLILIAADIMNFSIKYIHGKEGICTLSDFLNLLQRHFQLDKIDVSLLPGPINLNLPFAKPLALEYYSTKYIAVVAVLLRTTFIDSYTFFKYFFVIILIIVSLTYAMQILCTKNNELKIFNILEVLLGFTANSRPKKSANRIIFISIIAISMRYGGDFYSKLVEAHVVYEDIAFNTFKELDESNFLVFVNEVDYNLAFTNSGNKYIENLRRKAVQVANDTVCLNRVKKYKDAICVMMNSKAYFEVQMYLDASYEHFYRLAKPIFGQQTMAQFFDRGSPYTVQFQTIFRKLYESGIWQKWDNIRIFNNLEENTKTKNYKVSKSELFAVIIRILVIGFITSTIALIIEFAIKLFKNYQMTRMNRIIVI